MERTTTSVAPRRRPRKFSGPSRPVTLTLPVETIEALTALDSDLSRAIVRIAQPEVSRRHAAAELARFGRRAVIVVNASRALERRGGVDLVPPARRPRPHFVRGQHDPGCPGTAPRGCARGSGLSRTDRETFEAILEILKTARRSGEVAVLRRNIIVLEGRSRPRSRARPSRLPHNTAKPRHQRSME